MDTEDPNIKVWHHTKEFIFDYKEDFKLHLFVPYAEYLERPDSGALQLTEAKSGRKGLSINIPGTYAFALLELLNKRSESEQNMS